MNPPFLPFYDTHFAHKQGRKIQENGRRNVEDKNLENDSVFFIVHTGE
jgi:hypothetical protein